MSSLTTMYAGKPFSPLTKLSDSISSGDSVIKVDDVSVFPDAPNLATILDANGSGETVLYTAKTSNSLSGCQRGLQGGAKSHLKGAEISRFFTAYDYDTLVTNITKLNTDKVEKDGNKVLSDKNFSAQDKSKLDGLSNYNDTEIRQELNKKVPAQPGYSLYPDSKAQTDYNFSYSYKNKLDGLKNYDDTMIKQSIQGIDTKTNTNKDVLDKLTRFVDQLVFLNSTADLPDINSREAKTLYLSNEVV